MPKLAFIDLDETLIHTTLFDDYSNDNLQIISKMVNEGCLLQAFTLPHVTKIRPNTHEFLQSINNKYSTYLFTNANEHYAKGILDFFDLNKYFIDTFTRQNSHTIIENIGINQLYTDNKPNFILIDDAPTHSDICLGKLSKLGLNEKESIKHTYIETKGYNNEEIDNELLKLIKHLDAY